MNLTIDIGNTFTKIALMEKGDVVKMCRVEVLDRDCIASFIEGCEHISGAIVCSLKDVDSVLEDYLKQIADKYLRLTPETKVPLKNLYQTPMTLGVDRMAAAVGASALFPDTNLLVVDFGTAITIDVVTSSGEFLGGNISPGAATRFRALNTFTESLPLLSLCDCKEDALQAGLSLGRSTREAIEKGVVEGIVLEIEGYMTRFFEQYEKNKVIFTGGDEKFFAKKFKNTIFATCDLVMYGLNRIMEHNA
ncbi:MAG: type III pantothenate kinase [Rikenellaceae bacterium]